MNRKLVQQFKRRWDEVKKREIEELRRASYSTRFKQLTAVIRLARSLHIMHKADSNDEQAKAVRKRWLKLRNIYGVVK